MTRLIIFLFVWLWQCLASYGSPIQAPIISEHLTIKNGLSDNFVTDIVQDKQGFLWIGTESGLNRFDGENFRTYSMKNSPIVGNAIQRLYYDKGGNRLWIGTKRGLSILDCTTQQFVSLKIPTNINLNNIVDFAPSKDGSLWIVNHYDNIIRYNSKHNSFHVLNSHNTKGLANSFRCIKEGANGIVYIGHVNEGLSILNKQTGKVRNYRHNPKNIYSLPSNDVFCIQIDHFENVWIGTSQGLALFDPITERFISFLHNPSNPYSPIGNHIYSIREMNDNTLWIASDMGGISILDLRNLTFRDPKQLQFINLEATFEHDNSISSPNTRALFQDSFGNIWIGNYSSGLDFVSRTQPIFNRFPNSLFESKPIWSLYVDKTDDILWTGSINNLVSIKNGKILKVYNLSEYISTALSHITALCKYKGKLILGIHDNGALSLDVHTGKVTRIMPTSTNNINSLCETPDGKLLIGEKDGLYQYDGNRCIKLQAVANQFFNLTPNGMVYDAQNKLWIGTYGLGVYIFDKNLKLKKRLDSAVGFASNAIIQIFKDSKGGMWIAGQDGLAYIKDTKHPEKYINYHYKNGLNDIYIHAIQEDRHGDIWLTLNSGITRLNRKTNQFDYYDYNDGLPQSNFQDRAVAILKNGDICFGSLNGICVFNPDNLSASEKVTPIQIVECQNLINDTTNNILIPRSDGKIKLSYNHNSVRITFAVPDFSQSHLVQYSYMMEGVDKEWIDTQGEHQATLRNLSPGKYIFKVRARLKNQNWDKASIATIPIIVEPPLWMTWWAYLIYLGLIVMAIYFIARYYKHRIILKNQLILEHKKSLDEKALNDERLRFYTNITHELRTPLTLILGPLEDLVSDDLLPGKYKNKIQIIHESAQRLLNLINQILEFRKAETQNRKLTVCKGNLTHLIMEIGLRYKELNHNKLVKFEIHANQISTEVYYDNEIITTILNNLISNAMKYTPSGKITLGLREIKECNSDYIEVSVADTGYGIEEDALPHIFDRYYQAKGKHQASGSGIGLALVKSLSDLHEAILTVESKLNVGSTFRLLLLKDNTYPTALHKELEVREIDNSAIQETMAEPEKKEKPLVLVVEDNEAIRDYIDSSLNNLYRIILSTNGQEGLEMAQQNVPDIIISDIMMPVMDGIELCKHIKGNINTSHIPIILLTAKDSIQDKEEGYDSGADSYLTKPFSAKLLISRIHNILESRKMLAAIIASRIEGKTVATSDQENKNRVATTTAVPLRLNKLDEEFLKRFTTLVEKNLTVDLDMPFIQEHLHMSHSTIYRKIKSLTGMSGNEFIRKIRLKHGYAFLRDGYNVTEAAYSCGFGDIKHFRNSFKEEYGITPSQFIKNLKNDSKSKQESETTPIDSF